MCGQTDNNSREILQNLQALGEPPVFFALLHLGEAFFLTPLVVPKNRCNFGDALAIILSFGEPFPTIAVKYEYMTQAYSLITSLFNYYKPSLLQAYS